MSRVYFPVRAQCTQCSRPFHPEPGLIEPRDIAGSDVPAGPLQESVQLPGSPGGDPRDRPGRQRHAEQLRQRLRSALPGQELPDIQVDDDRRHPRPVLHRGLRPLRGPAPGAVPAAALALDQLMLRHLDRDRRQVKDLAALHRGDRPARPAPHPEHDLGSCRTSRSGFATWASVWPGCPSCPPGFRPVFFRSDRGRGGGFANPSADGGLEEFRDVCLSGPQARRSVRPPAPPLPPHPPVPGAATPPARPAPHTTAAPDRQAHPDTTGRRSTPAGVQPAASKPTSPQNVTQQFPGPDQLPHFLPSPYCLGN